MYACVECVFAYVKEDTSFKTCEACLVLDHWHLLFALFMSVSLVCSFYKPMIIPFLGIKLMPEMLKICDFYFLE